MVNANLRKRPRIIAAHQVNHDAVVTPRRFEISGVGEPGRANGVSEVHIVLDQAQ